MLIVAEVEEKDQEKLQEVINAVVRSYYNGIDRVVINFEDTEEGKDKTIRIVEDYNEHMSKKEIAEEIYSKCAEGYNIDDVLKSMGCE